MLGISLKANYRARPKSLCLGSKIQAWHLFLVIQGKQFSLLTHLPPPSLSARFLQRVNSIMSRFSALLLASTIILQGQRSVSSLMAPLASQQKLICQNLSQVRGCLKARRAPWPPEKIKPSTELEGGKLNAQSFYDRRHTKHKYPFS